MWRAATQYMKTKALDAASWSARSYLNAFTIKEYGKMLKLEIVPEERRIQAEVLLKGERETVRVDVARYEMIRDNGQGRIVLSGIETSRPWMNAVIGTLANGTLDIPLEGKVYDLLNGLI